MIDRLKKILIESTRKTDINITNDTVLMRDLGIDSYDLVELVYSVEDEFDVKIPDKVLKTLVTVGDVIAFIEKQ